MDPAKPSLDLLRQLSDRTVLGALLDEPRLTRARIATLTGLSKPTVGESMRRLTEAGLVRDTGERTSGPGRAGTLFALADDLGLALAVTIAPDGVRADAVDVRGTSLGHAREAVDATTTPDAVERALLAVNRAVLAGLRAPVRLAVVSAADPVDRTTGRLVHLPDAPFLVGELSPRELLAPFVDGPVLVDNDVNWAARAERDADPDLADAAYLYLDQGLGCALVADGLVLRGAHGLAGEVAHVVTVGPDGNALPFTGLFAALDLRRSASTAVDVARVLDAVADEGSATRSALADGVAGVVAAVVALSDPAVVVLGGSWGGQPAFVDAVALAVGALPRPVPVRRAGVPDPAFAGARNEALRGLREAVLAGDVTGDVRG